MTLPSSHSSPATGFLMPSPHTGSVQSASHVADSPAVSHCSPAAGFKKPSPHTDNVQSAALHVAVLTTVSHFSPAGPFKKPSPHCTNVQSGSQAIEAPPVSHASPRSATALPHTSTEQVLLQPSPDALLPSSH